MSLQGPPEVLDGWINALVGQPVGYRWVHKGHTGAQLWQVVAEGYSAFLKVHPEARKFSQEYRAYQLWTPYLTPFVPRCLAHHREPPRALLLSSVPGRTVDAARLASQDEARLHYLAGTVLRRLHNEVPFVDRDPVTPGDALLMRVRAWAKRAEEVLDAALIRRVTATMQRLVATPVSLRRAPSHGDFSPKNWLVRGTGEGLELFLVDFEHAAPHPWLWDLARLWTTTWRWRPNLQEAFARGYGRNLNRDEQRALCSLAVFDVAVALVWGLQHDHPDVTRQGRELFDILARFELL